jgi:murein DD-endopeptidase MepM/ murein hydrolase activator NlpD
MPFPLHILPTAAWTSGARGFGSGRDGGKRKHAGCDLLAPVDTRIYAVAPGKVLGFQAFYDHTFYIHVDHDDFEVRYGEVKARLAPGVEVGTRVEAGQHIGWVGFLRDYSRKSGRVQSMLHFEMYSGTADGPLTNRKDPRGFMRRGDLIDPTSWLDAWAKALVLRRDAVALPRSTMVA